MIDPVKKSVTVPLSNEEAFDLFTERMVDWWPMQTHSVYSNIEGMAPSTDLVFEQERGGKVIEKLADGTDAVWADITKWQPHELFEMAWFPGQSPAEATRVLVTFTSVDGGTRVDLLHDGFEARGDRAKVIGDNYHNGWDPVMACYAGQSATTPA